jgi:RND family efflux transporter MFP subunit
MRPARALPLALLALFVLIVLLPGCGADHPGDAREAAPHADSAEAGHADAASAESEHDEEESSEVMMTPVMMKESGVTVGTVIEEPVSAEASAPARVVPTQNGSAHVGTTVPGRVTRFFVSEGAHVSRGAALAEIESFGIGEVKAAYLRARAEVERNRAALDRSTRLSGEGIGAQRNLEEAQAALRRSVAEQSEAETKLRSLGISPESLHGAEESARSFDSRVVLRSPIAGVVTHRAVALGEFVEPDKDVFQVMNTGTVWVDAQVQPRVASALHVGGAGFVRDRNGARRAGRIIFIAPAVDSASRTVTVRLEMSNADNLFRPETFVTVELETQISTTALTVPTEAIERDGEKFYVYREHEPNAFELAEVEIGPQAGTRTVIRDGLKKGERIATSGVFYLKSVRQKGSLSDDD